MSVLLRAAPLPGPPSDLVVWTMTRVPLNLGQSYGRLGLGLGALLTRMVEIRPQPVPVLSLRS